MSELLYTDKLSVGYGDRTVVSDIALSAEPGQILCLIGPNGAGKSTLLKTLLRLLPPTAGAVYLEGKELRTYSERELARRSAAMLTGRPEPELMKSAEVVAAGRYPYTGRLGILSEEDRRVVRESMEKVGVSTGSDSGCCWRGRCVRSRACLFWTSRLLFSISVTSWTSCSSCGSLCGSGSLPSS